MNLPTQLYFGLPVWAQNVLLSTYGLSLRSRRYGGVHPAVLDELHRSQWYSASDLQVIQLARANEMIAKRSRPSRGTGSLRASYSTLTHLDELRDLPTITKDDVRQHLQQFVSEAPRKGDLLEVHTGGTTGTPLTIYCDRSSLQRNYAFFARLREWAGVPERARVATFAGRTIVPPGQDRPPFWRHNAAGRAVLYSSYHIGPGTIPQYVAHLSAWKPQLIDSYPSSLEPTRAVRRRSPNREHSPGCRDHVLRDARARGAAAVRRRRSRLRCSTITGQARWPPSFRNVTAAAIT